MGDQVFEKLDNPELLNKSPIFVFAADPLASAGIRGLGIEYKPEPHYRTRPEFLQLQREIVEDGYIDALLMTPADAEVLALDERIFDSSPVTPIVRMNSETSIWNPRHGRYRQSLSEPFRTVLPQDIKNYCELLVAPALECHVRLGLYSITLNNDVTADKRILDEYIKFAHEIGEIQSFNHILEVFLPNVRIPGMDEKKAGQYIADSLVRTMSYLRKRQRPLFIKTEFTTPETWQELNSFDPSIVIGALGGPRKNALDTLTLARDVVKYGGKVILFGRKVFGEDNPRLIAKALRSVLDQEMPPEEAYAEYQKAISPSQTYMRPQRF